MIASWLVQEFLKLHADPEDREKKMKKNHQNIFRTSGGPVYARLLSRINRANISVSEREGRKKLKTWIGILSILLAGIRANGGIL